MRDMRERKLFASSLYFKSLYLKVFLKLVPQGSEQVCHMTTDVLLRDRMKSPFEDFALDETPCCVNDSPIEFMGLVLFQVAQTEFCLARVIMFCLSFFIISPI